MKQKLTCERSVQTKGKFTSDFDNMMYYRILHVCYVTQCPCTSVQGVER